MTLLSICQDVARAVGISAPLAIVNNTSEDARRLLSIAQDEGGMLGRGLLDLGGRIVTHDWQELTKEYTFLTVSGTASYSLPSDFQRFVIETQWDRANYWQMSGPVSPQMWQEIKSGMVNVSGVRRRFRLRGGAFIVDPTPTASNETLVFEYVSKNWCESSGGTEQSSWVADTDTGIISEYLIGLGMKWRWRKAIGEAYAEDKALYTAQVLQAFGENRGVVRFPARPDDALLLSNIPESGYGA